MIRLGRFLLLAGVLVGAARADVTTTEELRGRLYRDGEGALVLTLDLERNRIAHYADKAGDPAEFDQAALLELIRERFHYLLRLRIDGHEAAPTSIEVGQPEQGDPSKPTFPLEAKWSGLGAARGEVVAQSDSKNYQLALEIRDERAASRDDNPLSASKSVVRESVRVGAWTGVTHVMPGAVGTLLFLLGIYFSGGSTHQRGRRLVMFLLAHSVGLLVAMSESVRWPATVERGWEFGAGVSVVGIAAANCAGWTQRHRADFWLWIGAGMLHGFALTAAFSTTEWPVEGRIFSMAAALGAIELILVGAVGLAALFRGALDRPDVAVPASVVVGLGGVGWILQCAQTGFAPVP